MISVWKIKPIIKKWAKEAGGVACHIGLYLDDKNRLVISTDKPGIMIGKAGELCEKYKVQLLEADKNIEGIKFIESAIIN